MNVSTTHQLNQTQKNPTKTCRISNFNLSKHQKMTSPCRHLRPRSKASPKLQWLGASNGGVSGLLPLVGGGMCGGKGAPQWLVGLAPMGILWESKKKISSQMLPSIGNMALLNVFFNLHGPWSLNSPLVRRYFFGRWHLDGFYLDSHEWEKRSSQPSFFWKTQIPKKHIQIGKMFRKFNFLAA